MGYNPDFDRNKPQRAREDEPALSARGGFRADGTFWPGGAGHDSTTRYVRSLIARRVRDAGFTPADCAAEIASSSASGILAPDLVEQWNTLTRPEDWRRAHTSNGAQEAIKRCGRDNSKPGHWSGAVWCDGPEHAGAGPLQRELMAHGWD